ncbi:copper resistance protein CopD [Mycolicibacterium cosmeticum]|uniref:ABC transporter permease n=1 Tax=Mycolicibacterium cosmeticum TaxID=258533 RepID=W9AZU2_MYCCO|nr:copper resistance protein CopD [Mycolicibacterium cosmeticum]CDO08091.1 ABC transporter permease [Mycolicibacterium cosmeticum]
MTGPVSGRRASLITLVAVAALAGITASVIGAMSLADAMIATGLPNPGPITTYGLPAVRAAGEIAAAIAVGGFLTAAFLIPAQPNGVLDVGGYRALRLGGYASAVWSICAALLVALSVSDVSGLPLHQLGLGDIWAAADLVEITNAWRWTAALAAVVAVASVPVLRWAPTPLLLLGSLITLAPLGLSGHSSSGGAHDIATNSLFIHLVTAALWMGGLLALLVHAWRVGTHLDTAARRFSSMALWSFVAVASSGSINAALRISPNDLLSDYGLLLAGKALAVVAVGVLGWQQRRSAVKALRDDPSDRQPLVRLGLCEAFIFAVTVGIAVGLSRTPPPPKRAEPSAAESAIGFEPAGAPTAARIMFDWRFDLILGTLAVVLAAVYIGWVHRLRRRKAPWPVRRSMFWLSGCAGLLVATSSGLGSYMPAMFSMHVLVQVLLSSLIPVLLVAGAPVTLALAALPRTSATEVPGPREWLGALLGSPLARAAADPRVVSVTFIGGLVVLHTETVFTASVNNHSAHVLTNFLLVVTGCLFFAVVSRSADAPRRRVAMLVAVPASYLAVGLLVGRRSDVLGESFYRSLRLTWHTDLLADQRTGTAIAVTAALLALSCGAVAAAWPHLRRRRTVRARDVAAVSQ